MYFNVRCHVVSSVHRQPLNYSRSLTLESYYTGIALNDIRI